MLACKKETPPNPPPSPSVNTVSDIDGNIYNIVEIGEQFWMSENLKTTKYCNGDLISNITDNNLWSNTNVGAWSNYSNLSENVDSYGKLYNWLAITDERNVCPCGWHVPSDDEWTVLVDYLGGELVAGGKMKGFNLWINPNTNANNSSGFSAMPSGRRNANGEFQFINSRGYFWSSTLSSTNSVYSRFLVNTDGVIYRDIFSSNIGKAVRCIKD